MDDTENEEWKKLLPISMVLMCPNCGKQHLDIGEWATRPHRRHRCENTPEGEKTGCGFLWMPHEYPTRGVESEGLPDAGHPHLINGEFQSDKYPTCPRGKVPLSVKDKSAQDLLWEYAQRRRSVDREFAADLESALLTAGYEPEPQLVLDLRSLAARGEGVCIPSRELLHLLSFIDSRRS